MAESIDDLRGLSWDSRHDSGEPRGSIGETHDGMDFVECDSRTDSRHNVWVRFEVGSTATLVGAFSNETPDFALDDSPLRGWISNVYGTKNC
jgi:hypothetical protein